MDKLLVQGGHPLKGQIRISGAKNSALKLMAASLLTEEPLHLTNLPDLADITSMMDLLVQHGVEVTRRNGAATLTAGAIENTQAPYDLVRKMRASVLVLGPLLARNGHAEVSLPGGCAIGTRPVDMHLMGLERLGAKIELKEGYIYASAPKGLKGAEVVFPKVSVGATENLIMAASLAKGTTTLVNAAREPEIVDLCQCLTMMGADIEGAGEARIVIHGVERLGGTLHKVVPDRIETGTYLMAAGMAGGEIELLSARGDHLTSVIETLLEAGVEIEETEQGLIARGEKGNLRGTDVMTEAYPGFPTDLQAQMMALMSVAKGAAMITETIFENRFMHVPELARMGAHVTVHGASALVRGVPQLTGAEVMATDLRASVSLVLAALAAEGPTTISRVYHLDRGYDKLEDKLRACGAQIERLSGRAAISAPLRQSVVR